MSISKDMYYMEFLYPELLKKSPLWNNNATSAFWYLVPHYSTAFYHECVFNRNIGFDDCKKETGDYLENIIRYVQVSFPFWNASMGTDHVFVFTWDQASEVVGWNHSVRKHLADAVHLTTLGSLNGNGNFVPHKDIVIPPFANFTKPLRMYPDIISNNYVCNIQSFFKMDLFYTNLLAQYAHKKFIRLWEPFLNCKKRIRVKEWYKRSRNVWAYFRGTIIDDVRYSFGVRQQLLKIKSDKFKISQGHSQFYWEELGDATFSLCPSGWSAWSPRLFDSIITLSIPVIFADKTRLPFEKSVDYRSFSVKIANSNVSNLENVLISVKDIQRKRENMLKLRKHFVWNDPPIKNDAFFTATEELFSKSSSYKTLGNKEFH